jgi:hypothetical protein
VRQLIVPCRHSVNDHSRIPSWQVRLEVTGLASQGPRIYQRQGALHSSN